MADGERRFRSSSERKRSLENARKELIGIICEIDKIDLVARAKSHMKVYSKLRGKKKFDISNKKFLTIVAVGTILISNWAKNHAVPTKRDKVK